MTQYFLLTIFFAFLFVQIAFTSSCYLRNCLACQLPYKCTECLDGLSCCQSSCSNCQSQNTCMSCTNEYLLNNSLSICQLNNSCLQYSCSTCLNNTCNGCVSGFVFDEWTLECHKCPAYCSKCTISGKCY